MKNHQLKSCPFCGGKGKFRMARSGFGPGTNANWVECGNKDCKVETQPSRERRGPADVWNKRVK